MSNNIITGPIRMVVEVNGAHDVEKVALVLVKLGEVVTQNLGTSDFSVSLDKGDMTLG